MTIPPFTSFPPYRLLIFCSSYLSSHPISSLLSSFLFLSSFPFSSLDLSSFHLSSSLLFFFLPFSSFFFFSLSFSPYFSSLSPLSPLPFVLQRRLLQMLWMLGAHGMLLTCKLSPPLQVNYCNTSLLKNSSRTLYLVIVSYSLSISDNKDF